MREILCFVLFVAFIAVPSSFVSGQSRQLREIFQGQPPPPGAVTILGRAFFEAGEAGFGNSLVMLIGADDRNVREELGLTDTEVNSVRLLRAQMLLGAPQYANRFRTLTPETQQGVQDDLKRDLGRITEFFDNTLSTERKENVHKLVFQSLGGVDSPMINLSAMETLNLSDDQKTKLKGVFDEMREERMAHAEKALEIAEKVVAAGGPQNLSEEEQEELRKMRQELEAQSFVTARKLAERLRQHLTPEQLEREKQLIASRPAFLPGLPRQMREGNVEEGDGGYAPGAGSWRPGQALPVQIQDRRDGRFPRGTTTE